MNPTDGIETLGGAPLSVLGHQGGWDEILLVAGPLLIVALLLWVANRRVTAQLEQAQPKDHTSPGHNGNGKS